MTTRRAFLQGSASAAAALTLGFQGRRCAATPGELPEFKPNIWLRLRKDGKAVLVVAKSEMGQGVRTSLPMILADELELPWNQIELEQAMPSPDFQRLSTGGSTSVSTLWSPLRKAAAAAREMLISAAAQRWSVPEAQCKASQGYVIHGPSGRKLAYGALVEAAAKLSVPKEPTLKPDAELRLVGKPVKRFEGSNVVTGKAVFGFDFKVPGMKVAVVARCPVAGGKALRWNEAVKGMPGIHSVVAVPSGVAVVAETTHQALRGREALKVEWDFGPHKGFDTEGFRAKLEALLPGKGEPVRNDGDVEKSFASVARRLEAQYEFPFQAHATLEPPAAIADVRKDGCDIWVGSQNPNPVQVRAATQLGLKPDQVRVHVLLMGGGFGRRLAWDFPLEAVEVSRAAGVPVKVVWTRQDDLAHDWFHPMSLHGMAAGLDAAGRVTTWHHKVAAPSILLSWQEGKRHQAIPSSETSGAFDAPYFPPNLKVEYLEAPLHLNLCWWRSIQAVPNTFARECFVDELAVAAGKDPVAFRLELMGDPRKAQAGTANLDMARFRKVLEEVARRSGWGKPLPKGRARGVACACFHGTYVAEVAEVSVDGQGRMKVEKVFVVVDLGRLVNPLNAEAQVEGALVWALSALRTQITFKEGCVQQSSYADFPVLTLEGMPKVDTHFIPSTQDPSGLGEPPVVPLIPAVLNAYAAATGTRIRRLPMAAPLMA